ncbi:hypothetical protein B0T22DRAFT_32285 [Podospora appendiculata]|uniref:Uncharacterized protein n=1 Tax=Podospora appendiculata TaxID=314037 RepID=A0AAE0XGE7_9PEZI|nr:hypothetical protein B0T22DRAFT_32285 [Podospora appendiculata]
MPPSDTSSVRSTGSVPPSAPGPSTPVRKPYPKHLTRDQRIEIRALRNYAKWTYDQIAAVTPYTHRQIQGACTGPLSPKKKGRRTKAMVLEAQRQQQEQQAQMMAQLAAAGGMQNQMPNMNPGPGPILPSAPPIGYAPAQSPFTPAGDTPMSGTDDSSPSDDDDAMMPIDLRATKSPSPAPTNTAARRPSPHSPRGGFAETASPENPKPDGDRDEDVTQDDAAAPSTPQMIDDQLQSVAFAALTENTQHDAGSESPAREGSEPASNPESSNSPN